VITGGSAQIKGIAEYAKIALQLAARVGHSEGFGGVAENLTQPQYACVLGLMLLDLEDSHRPSFGANNSPRSSISIKNIAGPIKNIIRKLRA
jgi:cell division ATPase FtsA